MKFIMKKINVKQLLTKIEKYANFKRFSSEDIKQKVLPVFNHEINLPEPNYDLEFICNPSNRDFIAHNIKKRKGLGDIDKVLNLIQNSDSKEQLLEELKKIPNTTDPDVLEYPPNEPRILRIHKEMPKYDFKIKDFADLAKDLKMLRTDKLAHVSGSRSYILFGDLAALEDAIIKYSLKILRNHNFQLTSVPDIIPSAVVERCGLISQGERHLVFKLIPDYGGDYSLSGTAEIALAYKLTNNVFSKFQLPLKLCASSRCFRAEISNLAQEKGIYRVHNFSKVEMFVCASPEESKTIMKELVSIQEEIFSELGLHYRVLDMPPNELGASAYRKIDIEAWMPGRNTFGEISSCSNCTDYQARRLNIKFKEGDNNRHFAHTINGTAAAIPRLLIAICETFQKADGNIVIPECLHPYMYGKKEITKQKIPRMRTHKYKPDFVRD